MNKGKILITDDEVVIRELLCDFLKEEGYQCVSACDAFDALEKFKTEGDIDMIMSDIQMPRKSGLELLSEIKALDEDVVVIMISADKDIESAIAAMAKGAYDYVSKPFKLDEVALIANKAIEKRRLTKENKEYQRELEKKVAERTVELRHALNELDKTYRFTLSALVTALDTRDTETQGHALRVVMYSLKLARLMGLSDTRQMKVLEYGALLHDIGKIGIPDEVLRKPEKLSDEEWKVMKTHPVVGYKILHRIEFLEEASQIVLHHHEKYNGTGYPGKLKGEQIPLGARIFAFADTVDAMTSNRPYRKASPFEAAAEELEKYSGTQFDPQVVRAFKKEPLRFWKKEREFIEQKIHEDPDCYLL
ncbi:MAG: response regulator [Deltaproteobacteria bacterium]|nr:response regulator [Deltaproteobacteria bacterium]